MGRVAAVIVDGNLRGGGRVVDGAFLDEGRGLGRRAEV